MESQSTQDHPFEKRPLREVYKAIRIIGDTNGNRLLAISYRT